MNEEDIQKDDEEIANFLVYSLLGIGAFIGLLVFAIIYLLVKI